MIHIKTYEEFNKNLALNYDINYDFMFQGKQFYGGTEIPIKFKEITGSKSLHQKGNNARKKQQERENKRKKYSKEARIAKLMDFQTDDDLITFAPRLEPPTSYNVVTGIKIK